MVVKPLVVEMHSAKSINGAQLAQPIAVLRSLAGLAKLISAILAKDGSLGLEQWPQHHRQHQDKTAMKPNADLLSMTPIGESLTFPMTSSLKITISQAVATKAMAIYHTAKDGTAYTSQFRLQ